MKKILNFDEFLNEDADNTEDVELKSKTDALKKENDKIAYDLELKRNKDLKDKTKTTTTNQTNPK